MSATWKFCYESLTVISSVPEKSARCREVSAIKDVPYKKVSLYHSDEVFKILSHVKSSYVFRLCPETFSESSRTFMILLFPKIMNG